MPVEAKPLIRPDVLRTHVAAFDLPPHVADFNARLQHWANLLGTGRADSFKEQELLPDFLTDFFVTLLGYTRPADGGATYSISREKHVQVDAKFADAVLGNFSHDPLATPRYVVAVEGKGPRDPLDRPFAGRRMSAVDQAYRYAINLPCDFQAGYWQRDIGRGAHACTSRLSVDTDGLCKSSLPRTSNIDDIPAPYGDSS